MPMIPSACTGGWGAMHPAPTAVKAEGATCPLANFQWGRNENDFQLARRLPGLEPPPPPRGLTANSLTG
eukprot:12411857-Karenia_brevis.AAC.1